jgi:hypothetical protein
MNASVPIIPLRRPLTAPMATMCFARHLARKAVKAQLQAQGHKVSHVDARVIAMKANAYLDQHRDELIAEATMTIDSVPELRKLAEAEARRRRKAYQITPPKSARPTPAIPTTSRAAHAVPRKG